jgi:small subunit ribosomal protein S4
MAKNREPILKTCKSLGLSPATLGVMKETTRNQKQKRRKQSEYGMQLNEKQKVKFIYGVLEKPFRKYYEMAVKGNGITGEVLLQYLERRFDNVIFRLGYASTRREAKQLISHGHFTINGQKVNIPSYLVKPGMVIAVKESSRSSVKFKALAEANAVSVVPKWLEKDGEHFSGKVVAMPAREDIDYEVQEQLIVELYSK